MLLWPIINIFFVVLVGYDSDVTKAIRDLRQKRWRSMSVMTSTIDLTRLSNHNNNNDNRHGCCHHRIHKDETEEETDEDTDEYLDLDLIRLERWKSARTGERRFSLPNLNNSSTTTMET
jgi:hypothetical protein